MPALRRLGRAAAAALVAFGLAFAVGYWTLVPLPRVDVTWRVKSDALNAIPMAGQTGGREILFVFIGASTCAPSNARSLRASLDKIRLELFRRAGAGGANFATYGIAKDLDIDSGLEHLRQFGRFDEIAVGRGWFNQGLLRYVFDDLPGEAGTPQILVLDRVAVRDADSRTIESERVLVRKVGLQEIDDWVSRGLPMAAIHTALEGPQRSSNQPTTDHQ